MRRISVAIVVSVLGLCIGRAAAGQTVGGTAGRPAAGVLPDASFEGFFRKYTPPDNVFSPFAAWDAHLALRVTAVRTGSHAVEFATTFQTIGIDSPGSRVSVAGTGYIVRLGYVHAYSANADVSAGVIHLSSHLTRDLDQRIGRARVEGTPIPVVADPSEYNVPFLRAHRRWPGLRFKPEIDVALQPVNVRVGGRRLDDVRPVYAGTRLSLWSGALASVSLETQHEIGTRPLNNLALLIDLHAREQTPGRLQLFVSASPGRTVRVSPNVGGLRNGLALGLRMTFRAS